MSRLLAAFVVVVIAGSVIAQPPPAFGPPPAMPSQPVLQGPPPTPGGPVTAFGSGFYRSGGIFIGANGYLPYDTGTYLLAGTDGLARSTGVFMMSQPAGTEAAPYEGKNRCRIFRR
jgi:hypothetical protein